MDADYARLQIEVADLQRELVTAAQLIKRLQSDLTDAHAAIAGGPLGKGQFLGGAIADVFYQMCLDAGAKNYVELRYAAESHAGVLVTVQRQDGLSPGVLLKQAKDILLPLTEDFANGKDLRPLMMAATAWLARTAVSPSAEFLKTASKTEGKGE